MLLSGDSLHMLSWEGKLALPLDTLSKEHFTILEIEYVNFSENTKFSNVSKQNIFESSMRLVTRSKIWFSAAYKAILRSKKNKILVIYNRKVIFY